MENRVAITTSEAVGVADRVRKLEAPVICDDVGVQAPVLTATHAGASETTSSDGEGGRGKFSLDFDSYKEDPYIAPPNPYDPNILDDLGSEDESFHRKAHHVSMRLRLGQLDDYWVGDMYRFPFCQRRLSTDFNNVVRHAETLGSSGPKMGEDVNMYAFMANHKVFGIHLQSLRNVAMEQGVLVPSKHKPPKIKC